MDEISFYRDCDELLTLLMTTDERIFYNDLQRVFPNDAIRIKQEFLDQGIVKDDSILECLEINRSAARPLYNRRYYQNKADNAWANMKRDELAERSTISAEQSAKWAQKSFEAADKSANSASKANKIAIAAIVVSLLVAFFQIIVSCSPTIQLIFKLI